MSLYNILLAKVKYRIQKYDKIENSNYFICLSL